MVPGRGRGRGQPVGGGGGVGGGRGRGAVAGLCLVVVVVLDGLAAAHAVTHVVVGAHVQLVHGAPHGLQARAAAVVQRPALPQPVAGVAWTRRSDDFICGG